MNDKKMILKTKGLIKKYGDAEVLSGINLEIREGSFTVIMGPSGSGKSTLLYCLSGMEHSSEGQILYNGHDITNISPDELTKLHGNDFGFIFQSDRLVGSLTLYENILVSGLLCKHAKDSDVRKKADELIRKVGLEGVKNSFPSVVSGGEAQRSAVARAVIKDPAILFADEPTGALNKANSLEVMKLLSDQNKTGRTILLVTHDREAALFGSDILYLEDGRIVSGLKLSEYNGKDENREKTFIQWLDEQRW